MCVKKEGRKEKELATGRKHMCVQSPNCTLRVNRSPLADQKVRIDKDIIGSPMADQNSKGWINQNITGSPMADQIVRNVLARISLGRQWLTR